MKKLYLILPFFLLSFFSQAQYCIPQADCSYDDFIDRFTFNTISNLNSGGSNCGTNSFIFSNLTTSVIKGNSYTMTLQSGPSWAEAFGVWIDYNRNQNFNDPGEFVYASTSPTTNLVSVNITIPNTALSGNTRMRVRCNYGQNITANQACAPFSYGETEDYVITIQANNVPPVSNFYAGSTTTCNGTVSFFDQSSGNPTSWLWNFGDGNTSTLKDPVHTYTVGGTYTVTLTSTNAFGSDAEVKTSYITYSPGSAPVSASCSPATTSNCCGFGITQFNFNTINSSSGDGALGYQDLTCSQTTVLKGQIYPIFVKADQPAEHNIRAWLDYNNNGIFESSELILSADQVLTAIGNVTIPSSVVTNTGLRLRVSADYYVNPAPGPCTEPQVGQVEDYTVIILDNTNKPDVNFIADRTTNCSGTVQFTDQSQNLPTGWSWDFGDGNTSLQQNPTHTYNASGTYTVRLIASNTYGSDTLVKTNYVSVNLGSAPVTPACIPATTAYCCNYGIFNVTLSSINNTTNGGADGYKDYSCGTSVNLNIGFTYNLSVRTGPDNPEDLMAWIDYNNDGVFGSTELVLTSLNKTNHTGNILIPATATLNTPLRMRIMSDFVGATLASCNNVQWGQVEDYNVKILDPNTITEVNSELLLTAYPNPARESVYLNFYHPSGSPSTLTLTDLAGRIVKEFGISGTLNEFQVDLNEFSMGVYLLNVSGNGYSKTIKIIHE